MFSLSRFSCVTAVSIAVLMMLHAPVSRAVVLTPTVQDGTSCVVKFRDLSQTIPGDLTVDVQFSDMLHCRLTGPRFRWTWAMQDIELPVVTQDTTGPTSPYQFGFFAFLTDEFGEEIPGTGVSGVTSPRTETPRLTVSFELDNPNFENDLIFHDLHSFITMTPTETGDIRPGSWTLTEIKFTCLNTGGTCGAFVEPWGAVPEPATLLLLSLGIAGLSLAKRRPTWLCACER